MERNETRSVAVGGDSKQKSDELEFAVTIKPTYNSYKKKVMVDPNFLVGEFNTFLNSTGCILVDYYIEEDSKGLYHLHGIFKGHLPFYSKKGWHYHITKIYDSGWVSYIKKDMIKDFKIQCRTQNCFI